MPNEDIYALFLASNFKESLIVKLYKTGWYNIEEG